MQRPLSYASMFAVLLLSTACAPAEEEATADAATETAAVPAPPPPITQQEVEQSIQATVSAMQAGDGVMVAGNFADDGTLLNARGKMDSRQGIQDFWTEALKSGAGKNLKVDLLKWSASGDMAYILARYTGGVTAPSGHTLTVVMRQADGTLKNVAQVSIPDPVKN